MPHVKLIKTVVDRAKHDGAANQTFYRDTALQGFALRVTAKGAKTYVAEYRHRGRNRRVTLGRHGALTVEQARALAEAEMYGATKAKHGMGEDPAEQRKREREGDTLADVAGRYLDELRARAEAGARRGRLSGWEGACGLWERHVPAALKRRKVADVSTEDIRRVHKALADKAATADHVRTVLHAVLERAITEGLIERNPAAPVKRYAKPAKRRRALTLDELAALGAVLDEVEEAGELGGRKMDKAAPLALRLLALTGMRKSELLGHQSAARRGPREGLRWSDLDLDAGSYVLEAVGGGSGGKSGDPRTLPLGAAAVELLRAVKPDDADPDAPVVPSARNPTEPYRGLNHARERAYAAADIEGADTHSIRHTFESIAFAAGPAFAGALTGRAIVKGSLAAYVHVDEQALRDLADRVAGRIAQALAGELADVLAFERAARR